MSEKKIVLPGDEIASALEYLPSFGTYSDEDNIRSSSIGYPELNKSERTARVNILTKIPKLQQVGTYTYGVVSSINDTKAMVDLITLDSGKFRLVSPGKTAILKVENVRRGFVKSLKNEFKIGDIVKVKIINISKTDINLTTDERELGVVKAYCSKCRSEMKKIDNHRVKCTNCGWVETRKLSSEYQD